MEFASVVVAGIAMGSIYALMALAINIVFSARRMVNFAQGDLTMMAGFVGIWLIGSWGFPYFLCLGAAALFGAVVAVVIERVAVRPLPRGESSIAWILSILAVAIILSNASQLIFGTDPQKLPPLLAGGSIQIGGLRLLSDQLVMIAAAGVFMVAFHLLQDYTIHGKAMKATARDPDMASLLGIETRRYIAGAFALSGAMAALGAFLIGPVTFVSASLGFALGIKGFAAAALGGLGTFRGAVAGGLLLGVAETLASRYIGSSSKDSVALLVLSLILIFRPTGLLGEAQIVKM
jgi:branched-subunit amino acid ABC-type transport system permease component